MSNLDPPIVIEPPESATASVLWLHGLGADGSDFEPVVPQLGDAVTRRVRYVFPHAPRIPVTINGGMVMRAWYDISQTDLGIEPDERGIRDSEAILAGLIEAEMEKGLGSERIVVAGFSQGGAIALHTALRFDRPLAGILALSTYLPMHEAAARESLEVNLGIPVFMAHGSQDPLIPLGLSDRSRRFLESLGIVVECHTYPMPHSVCPEEVRDIGNWLERVLGVKS